jgi:hypothetical protein
VATPTWKPVENIISSITNANPGVVTTTSDHDYSSGAIVQFFFPANFGMNQLIGNNYTITVLSPTTFSINENTTNFDPFTISTTLQSPQVVPVGEVANSLSSRQQNTLTPTPT